MIEVDGRNEGTSGRVRAALPAAMMLIGALAVPASAWQGVPTAERRAGLDDSRWSAFVGCWASTVAEEADEAGLLCIRPAGEGVEMFTIRAGEIRTSDLLVGDGEARPIAAEGCEGWEEVSFSRDGRRAFTRSAYTCEGIEQAGTGVLALVSPNEWVDVRALEIDGERTSWVQRYRLVGVDRAVREGVSDPTFGMETAARAARFVAHRGVGFGEVEEAVREVDAEAVEGWLATRSEGFAPTSEDLEALADAGVPESVIDVVVATSFPERFRVDSEGAAEAVDIDEATYPRGARKSLYFGPRMPFGFRSYGYGYGYGWVPADAFFYGYGYGYPGAWGYRPGVVIIDRREAEPPGRIVNGRGYTRPGSGGGTTAVPRTGSSGGDRPAAAPTRRSGGDAPSEPADPPRRTARPRGPGG